jgi:DNA-binding response OmpR family regulator
VGVRVLVADGDGDSRSLTARALAAAGHEPVEAGNGSEAIGRADQGDLGLAVLEVMLPEDGDGTALDGFDVCRELRRDRDMPVMFLTHRRDPVDELVGLAVGADAYLGKPMMPRLIVAHAEALLRRTRLVEVGNGAGRRLARPAGGGEEPRPTVLELEGLLIDLDAREVTVNGAAIELTRTEFDLLVALARSPRRVLTRAQLLEEVWGDWYGSDHVLDVHLSRLRAKVLSAGGQRIGHAVRGVGFRLQP